MQEKLAADKTKQIIEGLMHKVMGEDPNYYYAPTTEVARAIHDAIQKNTHALVLDDQKLVKHLTVRDIQVILSFQ